MTELPDDYTAPADHDVRLAQARRRARWKLGDPSWADVIIGAYMHPRQDAEALEEEQEAYG